MLSDTQDELFAEFTKGIKQADEHAVKLTGQEQVEYLTKQSIAFQQLGIERMQKLTSDLITKATDMSPLNFKTDLNL